MVTHYKRDDKDKDKLEFLSVRVERIVVDEEAETCTTPTAKECRIANVLTCPPAPRKRKAFFLTNKHVPDVKKFKKVDKFFVSSDLQAMLGLDQVQVSCSKIPWRSKKKFL